MSRRGPKNAKNMLHFINLKHDGSQHFSTLDSLSEADVRADGVFVAACTNSEQRQKKWEYRGGAGGGASEDARRKRITREERATACMIWIKGGRLEQKQQDSRASRWMLVSCDSSIADQSCPASIY